MYFKYPAIYLIGFREVYNLQVLTNKNYSIYHHHYVCYQYFFNVIATSQILSVDI